MLGNEKGSSKTDTIVKLVLIFFISLLSFSVGTFVGKQVSDRNYKETASMEDHHGHAHRETASVEDNMESAEEEASYSLSDEEIESLTEEFVKAEEAQKQEEAKIAANEETAEASGFRKMGEQKANTASRKTASTEPLKKVMQKQNDAQMNKPSIPSAAAARVAADLAPSKKVIKKRPESRTLPSVATSSIGKYTVQVASYATEKEAQNYAGKLKSKGFNAFYIPANIKGKTWYRVSIGLFSNHTSAANYRKEVMKQANISSAIVQKIVR